MPANQQLEVPPSPPPIQSSPGILGSAIPRCGSVPDVGSAPTFARLKSSAGEPRYCAESRYAVLVRAGRRAFRKARHVFSAAPDCGGPGEIRLQPARQPQGTQRKMTPRSTFTRQDFPRRGQRTGGDPVPPGERYRPGSGARIDCRIVLP
ncbi:hypothetical protein P4O66_000498 [Electrophorus voltai]|uniref:Uncharacterized protein n=1 Tax=Electrophorus voltai TaxID=2609070 RepID=A0AAD8ZFK3_9TELE|nr:hypothetical protein P4O66_000498 [Electrophorus voltai]